MPFDITIHSLHVHKSYMYSRWVWSGVPFPMQGAFPYPLPPSVVSALLIALTIRLFLFQMAIRLQEIRHIQVWDSTPIRINRLSSDGCYTHANYHTHHMLHVYYTHVQYMYSTSTLVEYESLLDSPPLPLLLPLPLLESPPNSSPVSLTTGLGEA